MMRVRVIGRFRVLHDGRAYSSADGAVEVPDKVAQHWLKYGWARSVESQPEPDVEPVELVEPVQPPKPRRARR
ncbi:hypothetical protein [Mycobacterium attenuatum]|uniref:hypothetical protein n=1 Tax=Mycobacterium attenuatum TaxID=2341086 RepID=UPI000F2B2B0A|nr:hypothetical protein [Mycobacterium attenuatum]VBA47919.1 hypothetical protein LAUMK41_00639 [Mycobacterium attenuatum]